jgi:signal transduction histidine kinase
LIGKLQGPNHSICAFIDECKQLWIGTRNDGLYCYAKTNLQNYLTNIEHPNLLCVYKHPNGMLLAGNNFAEVHLQQNGIRTQSNFAYLNPEGATKFFLPQKNQLYVLGDKDIIGLTTNENIRLIFDNIIQIKSGVSINDSTIFIGSIQGGYYVNTITKQNKFIAANKISRVYACAINLQQQLFYTLTDEIYTVQFPDTIAKKMLLRFQENEVPVSLTCTKEGLLWIATNESRIYIVQKNKIIDTVDSEIALLENICHITNYDNQVVVSSKTGLAIINYSFKNALKIAVRYISQKDGLPSNVINQTFINQDSIYVATTKGIGVLSRNFAPKKYTINPIIQSIKINNQLIAFQRFYSLKAGVHNIQLELTGIDLSGHLLAMQYSLNDTLHWNSIEGNQLSLLLQRDKTNLYIRTKDIQNQVGTHLLACTFEVAIPYYKTIWFWVLMVAGILTLLFWLYNRQTKLKLKQEFDKQLALQNQRKKLTADLHDDIGATLSSLQLNSSIANRTLENNSSKASEILHTIETQAKELSEKVGDIIWSMNNEDAFGTFSDRIKTYTNQILDYTTIDYKINIDDQVDGFITDSIMKKNLILICKETINNAVKYSKANLLIIECNIQADNIHVNIKDNGIGFETKNTKGNGLINMQQRVAELNGTLRIISELNKGTQI